MLTFVVIFHRYFLKVCVNWVLIRHTLLSLGIKARKLINLKTWCGLQKLVKLVFASEINRYGEWERAIFTDFSYSTLKWSTITDLGTQEGH